MKTCVIGDVHGRVFHALLLVALCQKRRGDTYDLILQVGDMGAWPEPERADSATKRFGSKDSTEFDFQYLLRPGNSQERFLTMIAKQLSTPILFVRGNHEDSKWLVEMEGKTVDDFGIFKHVADATVFKHHNLTVAFLGGIENAKNADNQLRQEKLDAIMTLHPGTVDILVTHDAPFGVSKGYHAQTQGSEKISQISEYISPHFHVFGHLHHIIGPLERDGRIIMGIGILVENIREETDRLKQTVRPGCLAIIDHEQNKVEFVTIMHMTTLMGSGVTTLHHAVSACNNMCYVIYS